MTANGEIPTFWRQPHAGLEPPGHLLPQQRLPPRRSTRKTRKYPQSTQQQRRTTSQPQYPGHRVRTIPLAHASRQVGERQLLPEYAASAVPPKARRPATKGNGSARQPSAISTIPYRPGTGRRKIPDDSLRAQHLHGTTKPHQPAGTLVPATKRLQKLISRATQQEQLQHVLREPWRQSRRLRVL